MRIPLVCLLMGILSTALLAGCAAPSSSTTNSTPITATDSERPVYGTGTLPDPTTNTPVAKADQKNAFKSDDRSDIQTSNDQIYNSEHAANGAPLAPSSVTPNGGIP